MNINVLIEYCNKCRLYGWKGTWEGLKEYKKLKEKGLIKFCGVHRKMPLCKSLS